MKFFLGISLALLLVCNVSGQNVGLSKSAAGIEQISLARDDGKGKAGEITDKFLTTDAPIHFMIQLDSFESVTLKMNVIAVKAAGLKPETKSVNVQYTTDGNQSQVNFTASPGGKWAAGSYRADFFINNVFAQSMPFEIEKSPNVITAKPAAKNFVPQRRTRKN